jgi:predicted transcriptional regulator
MTVFPGFSALDPVASLTARRRELGLSQAEVAARMATTQSAVARLEAGSVDAKLSTLRRYAAALGGSLRWEVVEGA